MDSRRVGLLRAGESFPFQVTHDGSALRREVSVLWPLSAGPVVPDRRCPNGANSGYLGTLAIRRASPTVHRMPNGCAGASPVRSRWIVAMLENAMPAPICCHWCDSLATDRRGKLHVCIKHYRFVAMRVTAKADGKLVPTFDQLESMANDLDEMGCPHCKAVMVWRRKDGGTSVVSLQHDRSGEMRFLCLSCNARHVSCPDDSFYTHSLSQRPCSLCKKWLPLEDFGRRRQNGREVRKSRCFVCEREYKREYKRRMRQKAKQEKE